MILDQNTIVLNPCNGFYDEYTLVGPNQVDVAAAQTPKVTISTPIRILPGAIVGQATIDPVYDAKKYPFFIQPGEGPDQGEKRFKDALAEAKTKQTGKAAVGTEGEEGYEPAIESDGGQALEEFYAKYPRQHVITAGFVGGTATADDLDAVEVLILVENALLGKGIHSLYFPGEKTPVYSPVSGDRYLARCVPDTYTEGEPLYLCDYTSAAGSGTNEYNIKGYYFCKKSYTGTKSKEIKAFAGEDFICPDATNADRKPYPFFLDVVDDSTTERPATTNINGCITNLLRVRMA